MVKIPNIFGLRYKLLEMKLKKGDSFSQQYLESVDDETQDFFRELEQLTNELRSLSDSAIHELNLVNKLNQERVPREQLNAAVYNYIKDIKLKGETAIRIKKQMINLLNKIK